MYFMFCTGGLSAGPGFCTGGLSAGPGFCTGELSAGPGLDSMSPARRRKIVADEEERQLTSK